jgi:hypothetical protein
MSTTTTPPTVGTPHVGTHMERAPLSSLGRLTLAALIGFALVSIYWQVTVKESFFPPIGIVNAAGSLIAAGVIASRRRWTPLVGALWCTLMLIVEIGPSIKYLGDPGSVNNFIIHLLQLPLILIGIAAGIGAFMQYRRTAAD